MQGLLADVNVQGHLGHLHRRLVALRLLDLLHDVGIHLNSFPALNLDPDLDDRALWRFCQDNGWVLFTENRNHDSADSLQATLDDSWQPGRLPVLTIANKERFQSDLDYADLVAKDVADLLFGLKYEEFRDQPRIFVPRRGF